MSVDRPRSPTQWAKALAEIAAMIFIPVAALASSMYLHAPVARLHAVVSYRPDDAAAELREAGLGVEGVVQLTDIPTWLLVGLLFREDKHFFDHRGFDYAEIRASVVDYLFRGKRLRGASTISQQLARNIFLTKERSGKRKFAEAIYAAKLERQFSKEEILILYVNNIEWGPGIYGLEDAAHHYFAKAPVELSLEQSAFLIAIVPNPLLLAKVDVHGHMQPLTVRAISKVVRVWRSLTGSPQQRRRSQLRPWELRCAEHLMNNVQQIQAGARARSAG